MENLSVHIDITPLFARNPRGIGTYINHLMENLLKKGVKVYSALKTSRLQRPWLYHRIPPNTPLRLIPHFMGKVRLFHGTNRFLLKGNFPKVLTVHDMIEFYEENELDFPISNSLKLNFIRKTKACFSLNPEIVIAVSNWVKKEITRFTDYPEERIRVIYHGVSDWARPYKPEEYLAILRKFGLTARKYLVFVGEPEPRKNVSLVLKGLRDLPEEIKFVVIGGKLNSRDKILAFNYEIERRILEIPYLDSVSVGKILSGSLALVFPTKYEGFGLPVLEAMACGTPVITTNRPAVSEIVGDSAILVEPDDVYGFVESVFKLLENEKIREYYVLKGFEKSKFFSWDRTADETIKAYLYALSLFK